MRVGLWLTWGWTAWLCAAGCGGSTGVPEGTGEATSGGEETSEPVVPPPPVPHQSAMEVLGMDGPETAWADMSHKMREWYMIAKVQPIAHEIFRGYDAKRYQVFECAPCHGEDGKAKKYKMPNDNLGPIPAFDSEDFKQLLKSRLGKFMYQEVTPKVARILGMPPYDPETGQGFSCYACHPKEQVED